MITKVHDKLPIFGMDKPQRGLERQEHMSVQYEPFDEYIAVNPEWSTMSCRSFITNQIEDALVHEFVKKIVLKPTPKRIVRNGIALVVFWDDGTKTVVKCHDEDFDPEKGLAMALARKVWGRCGTVNLLKTIEEQEGKEKKAPQNTDKQMGAGIFVDATPDQLKELARLRKLKEAMNG